MKTKLKTLFEGIDVEIKGKKETEISGVCGHSRQVAPGDLFIAEKGDKDDGSLYIEEALKAGAAAVLTDLYNPFINIPQIIHKNPKGIKSIIAKRFYQDPSNDLYLVGITGTNGKTTTSYLVQHLLQKDQDCGLIGTIETLIKSSRYPSSLTTPDVLILNKALFEMRKKECRSCVMEVSSHALAQGRVDGVTFDAAIFTNLSQDHLDYHGSMEEYALCKAKLFQKLSHDVSKKDRVAILNEDDPYFSIMSNSFEGKKITYGLSASSDVFAKNIEFLPHETRCEIVCFGQSIKIIYPLIGKFNLYNVLAATALAFHKGQKLEEIGVKIESFPQIKGRMQSIKTAKELSIIIDFAHTEKALENVLMTLREFTKKKIILVIGCGGDRDKDKRGKIGQVASMFADHVIFTSDNPRSEDPKMIIQQMLDGASNKKNIEIHIDRKEAIFKAISLAQVDDVVLIAGKGHEMTQTLKDKTVPFSDEKVVIELISCL